jgi:S-layer homology domain
MKSNSVKSKSGTILAASGILISTIMSAKLPAQAISVQLTPQKNRLELAAQPSDLSAKDNDRKKPEDSKKLPKKISEAVFKDISKKYGIETSKLRIVQAEPQTWADGCLGLANTDSICTQSLISGWRVVVASSEKSWVYRTNEAGTLVKFDEVATRTFSSDTTSQVTRQEITTSRTTETTRTVTGSNQGTASTSQNSTTQSTQVTGNTQTNPIINSSQQTQVTRRRTEVKFSDISQNFWAKDYIAELAGRGIITGFPDGKFRPNEPVTRAQFAALVASVFNKNKVRNLINFRDVSTKYWAYEGVRDAYEMGFLEVGNSNEFNPDQSLTRIQIITSLVKGLNYATNTSTEKVLQYYTDAAAIPTNYRRMVAAATEKGIVVNYPNAKTCNPNQVATRAEVAAIIYQAMVSNGDAAAITSPYIAGTSTRAIEASQTSQPDSKKPRRQNCNQGIGNGAEGCDPGNSRPRGGSNDEGGRTPGNRPNK